LEIQNHELIIGHGQTKRVIRGPFQILGRGPWLRSIAEQILKATDGHDDEAKYFYGWIDIAIHMESAPMADLSPVEWDDKAKEKR